MCVNVIFVGQRDRFFTPCECVGRSMTEGHGRLE